MPFRRFFLKTTSASRNFLLQLFFTSFSLFFDLECAFARSLEDPRPVFRRNARHMNRGAGVRLELLVPT